MPKVPKMPKMPKVEVFYRFYKKKCKQCYYIHLLISGFKCWKYQVFIIETERSDATILGILDTLGILGIFRLIRDRGLEKNYVHFGSKQTRRQIA